MTNSLTARESGAMPWLAVSEEELLDVLRNSLYPGAKDASIKLVLGYCKAASLDPMQKPVHIVPMDVDTGRKDDDGWPIKEKRDVIMPGIGLYRAQAEGTREYGGLSEPEYGPTITLEYEAEVWGEGPNGKRQKRLTPQKFEYPEWCKVTVERIVDGQVRRFTAKEFWIENYATKGSRSIEPNAMWKKRPRGQIAKCTEAQALRKAFARNVGSQPTADEIEGKSLYDDDRTIDMESSKPNVPQPRSKSAAVAITHNPGEALDMTSHQQPRETAEAQRTPRQRRQQAETGTQPEPTTAGREPGSDDEPDTPPAEPVSDSVMRILKTKMEQAALGEADLRKRFDLGFDGVTKANYNAIVAWIDTPMVA